MRTCGQCGGRYGDEVRFCPVDGAATAGETPVSVAGVSPIDRTEVARSGAGVDDAPPISPCQSPGAGSAVAGAVSAVAGASSPPARASAAAAVAPSPGAPTDGLRPGTMVGEYQLLRKLGEGGMGTVYAGVHPLIGKRVAVKVLNPGLSRDAGIVTRFITEARAVNQIGHRNIVDIFAFGELDTGECYFVMEHLQGESLEARIEKPPPLTFDECFAILVEVCDALKAAHAEGIVHRDLKPANVFLCESKSGERTVKLLDFGIAKLLRTDGEMALQRTRTGVQMGTPLYMSPEQCLGQAVDARTDVYAVGVMMFELFTGRLPFPGPSYIETVNGHLYQAVPRPTDYVDIPTELERLVFDCMEKEADARVATIGEVRDRLRAIARTLGADGALRRTIAPTGDRAAQTPVRRTPSGAAGNPGSRAPTRRAPAGRRRRRAAMVAGGLALVFVVAAAGTGFVLRRSGVDPAAARAAELQVLSDPAGATVTVDGKTQALRTPSLYPVARGARHVVAVELDGYRRHEEVVEVGPGEAAKSLVTTLAPLHAPTARLEVRTGAPGARFTLDGAPVGDGSGRLAIDVAPGRRRLAVSAPGYAPREETLDLAAHQQATLEWTLAPAVTAPAHPGAPVGAAGAGVAGAAPGVGRPPGAAVGGAASAGGAGAGGGAAAGGGRANAGASVTPTHPRGVGASTRAGVPTRGGDPRGSAPASPGAATSGAAPSGAAPAAGDEDATTGWPPTR